MARWIDEQRRIRSGSGSTALALALPMILAFASASVADDLLPPISATPGGAKPAPAATKAEELPAIPSASAKAEDPPPFPSNQPPPSLPANQPAPMPAPAPSAAPVARPEPPGETLPAPAAQAGQDLGQMKTLPRRGSVAPTEPATRDAQVVPAQTPGGTTGNPLPESIDAKGAGKPEAAGAAHAPADGFAISADRLPIGPQMVGVSIEVVAPKVMNINHPATVKLVLRNTGNSDVSTVRVRYQLPKELSLVSSQPEAQRISADDPLLIFMLNTLAAGSERIITLKVKANAVASIDHAARVDVLAGSRARTVIQQPVLKVEMPDPIPSKVLKGQQVKFKIAIKNDGNGPARDVEISARLSNGLKADENDVVGQTIPIIQAGERIELDPLIVDTFAGGEQTCKVVVTSPDVAPSPNDMTVTRSVFVTKPELTLKLSGPPKRYTDTLADYTLTVENPGTAAAKNVNVTAILPTSGGRLVAVPGGAQWVKETRRLSWLLPNLDPGEKSSMTFQVRLGGMGLYQVAAEARSGELSDKESFPTDVSGFPDIQLEISERRRVLDVGEYTVFDIKVVNRGTKDASNVRLSAFLSPNLVPSEYAVEGFQLETDPPWNEKTGEVRFPVLPRLATNRPVTLSIKAQAKQSGVGTCKVYLEHDDLPGTKLEDFAHTTVTGGDTRTK
jgi:uncharacterized repeat protein (TIGR01451 family)